MALVPFPVSSSAPVAPASPASRASGPVRGPQAGVASFGSCARASGTSASSPPAGAKGTAQATFAHVLAAAQDDESGAAVPDGTAAGSRRFAPTDADTPVPDAGAADDTETALVTVPVGSVEESRLDPASSWLLLALGQGGVGRADHEKAVVSPDDEGAAPAAATAAIDPVAGVQAVVVPVLLPDAASTPPPARTAFASEGTGQVATAGEAVQTKPVAQAAAQWLPQPTVLRAAGATEADLLVAPADPRPDAAVADAAVAVVADVSDVSDVSDTTFGAAASADAAPAPVTTAPGPAPRPAPEAVARWRVASRGLAEAVRPRIGAVDPEPRGVVVSMEPSEIPVAASGRSADAPAAAVRDLARLLGGAPRVADEAGRAGWTAPTVGEAAAVPVDAAAAEATRSIDVISRLAPPGGQPEPDQARVVEPAGVSGLNGMPGFASSPPPPAASPVGALIPTLPPAVGEQVQAHIVSSLKMQWKEGVGEAKLHLRPDDFGTVTVALRVEHGAVTAVVRSDSPQVQDWVLQHQQTLRQQMESAGLRLDELTVSPDDRGQRGKQEPPAEQRRRTRRARAQDGDTPVFELLA